MNALWLAVLLLAIAGLLFGLLLGFASRRFAVDDDPLVENIDNLLPQSQCAQCGYPGCRPYAQAICHNNERINRCVPGGDAVMRNIATLLNVEPQPMEGDADGLQPPRMLALIDESQCIGCTKCIQACPVDAIIGSTRAMHTVLSELCTGCNLCVDPCPTHCISLRPVPITPENWQWDLNSIPVRIIDSPSTAYSPAMQAACATDNISPGCQNKPVVTALYSPARPTQQASRQQGW